MDGGVQWNADTATGEADWRLQKESAFGDAADVSFEWLKRGDLPYG
jgi:hypothetical protein